MVWHSIPHLSIRVAALLSTFPALSSSAIAQEEYPKASAPQREIIASIGNLGPRRRVTVSVLLGTGQYWQLPVFEVRGIIRGGQPLFKDNQIQLSGAEDTITVRLVLGDVLADSKLASQVREAVEADPAVAGKVGNDAPGINQQPCVAYFEVRDMNGDDVPLAATRLRRRLGADEITINFRIPTDLLQQLGDREPDDFSTRVSCTYFSEYGETDYAVTADFLNSEFHRAWSKVVSDAGSEQVLFIPVGGTSAEESNFTNRLIQYLNVQIKRYQRPEGDRGAEPEPVLVREFISNTMNRLFQSVELAQEGNDTRLVFLLSSGISVRTTLGSLRSTGQSMFKMTTTQSRDLVEQLARNSSASSTQAGLDVVLPLEGLLVPLGLSFSDSHERMTETQRKELHERFRQDMAKLDQQFAGDLPTVSAMNLSSARSLLSSNVFSSRIAEVRNVEVKEKVFEYRLSFQAQIRETRNRTLENVEGFGREWYERLIRWRMDPQAAYASWDGLHVNRYPDVSRLREFLNFDGLQEDLQLELVSSFRTGFLLWQALGGLVTKVEIGSAREIPGIRTTNRGDLSSIPASARGVHREVIPEVRRFQLFQTTPGPAGQEIPAGQVLYGFLADHRPEGARMEFFLFVDDEGKVARMHLRCAGASDDEMSRGIPCGGPPVAVDR